MFLFVCLLLLFFFTIIIEFIDLTVLYLIRTDKT